MNERTADARVPSAPRRTGRSVGARIVFSYVVVLCVFAATSGWSVFTFRAAVGEADLLRRGYLPLTLRVHDLVSNQDTWNTQLNHVTTAGNPADIRVWFDTALRIGRPKKLAEVRGAITRAFASGSPDGEALRSELLGELSRIEQAMRSDGERIDRLFAALGEEKQEAARVERDELVRRGSKNQGALARFEERISAHVDGLVDRARAREEIAFSLLVLSSVSTILVGALMALYARRVVAPVGLVTARARAVALGDLSARAVVDSGDEMGELSATFEGMVEAISSAREKLLAAERLAAIGKMAAHVTHEVRNPLSSIGLNLELLEDELSSESAEARSLVRAIGQEVQRLSGLSDQYLSMARRKAPEFEECDVAQVVLGATEFSRREMERSQIELVVRVEPELPSIWADPGQLRQALYNLLRNAREAMLDGGRVWVSATSVGDRVRIEVADEGPGVPEERVERLFDPFYTTKDHGTGLGLAVTREIAVAHGGRLTYESGLPRDVEPEAGDVASGSNPDASSPSRRPATGSRFGLELPRASEEGASPGPSSV